MSSVGSGSGRRPLVVLAGWLGCQTKSLRRYQALYDQLGMDTTIVIATPRMVVQSTFHPPPPQQQQQHLLLRDWSQQKTSGTTTTITTSNVTTMQDLAWKLLRQVHFHHQPPYFFFHAFSNGGCFLWEEIRTILNMVVDSPPLNNNNNNNNLTASTHVTNTSNLLRDDNNNHQRSFLQDIQSLRNKLCGVVFDSCPAALYVEDQQPPPQRTDATTKNKNNLVPLYRALEYCAWQERWPLLLELHAQQIWSSIWMGRQQHFLKQQQVLQQRAQLFYNGMRDDPWMTLPHLYLYSQDDHLTLFAPLHALVQHRMQLTATTTTSRSSNIVSYLCWESSPHCCHLLYHPQEYQQAVTQFVNKCLLLQQQYVQDDNRHSIRGLAPPPPSSSPISTTTPGRTTSTLRSKL